MHMKPQHGIEEEFLNEHFHAVDLLLLTLYK